MASKPMRLTDYAESTALKYGKSVSAGIKEMESQIERLKLQSATMLQPATPNVAFSNWDEFEDHVLRALSKGGIRAKVESEAKPPVKSVTTPSGATVPVGKRGEFVTYGKQ